MPSRWLQKMDVPNTSSRATAWAVHLFSASGAVLALLAVLAIQGHRWTEAMLWLFAALVVDGVDGTMARAARVKDLASRVDGAVLDLVIDYLNYVFVPTLFIIEAGLLPDAAALPLAALIQLSSLYVFARRDMKTDDNYFRGFPALWNIVALYLFAAGLDPGIAAVVVAALVFLTFAPIHFVHPIRVRDYGFWLPILALLWSSSTLALLFDPPARSILLAVSAICAFIIVGLGLWRTARGPKAQSASNSSAVSDSTSATVRSRESETR
jgi:phosphatidylcholine synthase